MFYSFFKSNQLSRLIFLINALIFISLIGAFQPVIFDEGSAFAKFIEHKHIITSTQDKEVERALSKHLYSDSNLNTKQVNKPIAKEVDIQKTSHTIFIIDKLVCFLITLTFLFCFQHKRLPLFFLSFIYLTIFIWFFMNAVAINQNAGKSFSELSIPAHATRWMMPIICLLLIILKRKNSFLKLNTIATITVLACSSTFLIHGYEAFQANPPFQDLLYNSLSFFNLNIPSHALILMLKSIGVMDIALALIIVFYRNQNIYLWMIFWGLITAFSRPISIGLHAWPEAAMRSANFGIPLTLFLLTKYFLTNNYNEYSNES
jgi:hypothetical protein